MACGDLRAATNQCPDVLSLQRGSIPAPPEAMASCLDASQGGSSVQQHGLPSLDLQLPSSQPVGLPQGIHLPQTLIILSRWSRQEDGKPQPGAVYRVLRDPPHKPSMIIIITPAFLWRVD